MVFILLENPLIMRNLHLHRSVQQHEAVYATHLEDLTEPDVTEVTCFYNSRLLTSKSERTVYQPMKTLVVLYKSNKSTYYQFADELNISKNRPMFPAEANYDTSVGQLATKS
jgi:hypothetical protein